ncbi:MAG: ATP-binding protein [Rhodospirillales bacterium]|nr:ATP-binding protein [Rhodospirillales bacterium]
MALADRARDLHRARVYEMDALRIGRRPPAQAIARRIPEGSGRKVNTASDFLGIPRLDKRAFVIRNIDRDIWRMWGMFARDLRRAAKEECEILPQMIFTLPPDLPDREIFSSFGRKAVLKWIGVIDRLDCTIWHDRRKSSPAGLISRLARETSIEVAGPNTTLLEGLTVIDEKAQIEPWQELRRHANLFVHGKEVCWRDGLVDEWDDAPRIDSLVLAVRDQRAEFEKRVWRAHSAIVFPYVEEIRAMIVRRHRAYLDSIMPWTNAYYTLPQVREHPSEIDITELQAILGNRLSREERALITHAICKIRHKLAHMSPLSYEDVEKLATLKDTVSAPAPEIGWDWPRCGQRLIMMIGSPASGKTTWVRQHHDPAIIVSSDDIREGHPEIAANNAAVFKMVRQRVHWLLKNGSDAAIDATHLKADDRLEQRRIAPNWVPVEYVVVDRPLEDKLRDGGWRLERRPGLIEEQHEVFQLGKEAILAGDGDPRVTVTHTKAR